MSKADYEGLLKITDRAIQLLVCWKKAFFSAGQNQKHPHLAEGINGTIAELAEYRFELKKLLKGQSNLSANDKLRLLIEEIESSVNSNAKEMYIQKLLALTKTLLDEGLLEVMDGN